MLSSSETHAWLFSVPSVPVQVRSEIFLTAIAAHLSWVSGTPEPFINNPVQLAEMLSMRLNEWRYTGLIKLIIEPFFTQWGRAMFACFETSFILPVGFRWISSQRWKDESPNLPLLLLNPARFQPKPANQKLDAANLTQLKLKNLSLQRVCDYNPWVPLRWGSDGVRLKQLHWYQMDEL